MLPFLIVRLPLQLLNPLLFPTLFFHRPQNCLLLKSLACETLPNAPSELPKRLRDPIVQGQIVLHLAQLEPKCVPAHANRPTRDIEADVLTLFCGLKECLVRDRDTQEAETRLVPAVDEREGAGYYGLDANACEDLIMISGMRKIDGQITKV